MDESNVVRRPRRWRAWAGAATAAVVLATGLASSSVASADSPVVLPPDGRVHGRSYGEWSAEQWKWVYSMPESSHPLSDKADCSAGQRGKVWFLGGTYTTTTEPSGGYEMAEASSAEEGLRVAFPDATGAPRLLAPARLPAWEPVYAMTIHKSQGSEFDAVAVVLPRAPSANEVRLLTRELLYTAITRARRGVHLFATDEVLEAALARRTQRASGLRDLLWAAPAIDSPASVPAGRQRGG